MRFSRVVLFFTLLLVMEFVSGYHYYYLRNVPGKGIQFKLVFKFGDPSPPQPESGLQSRLKNFDVRKYSSHPRYQNPGVVNHRFQPRYPNPVIQKHISPSQYENSGIENHRTPPQNRRSSIENH